MLKKRKIHNMRFNLEQTSTFLWKRELAYQNNITKAYALLWERSTSESRTKLSRD